MRSPAEYRKIYYTGIKFQDTPELQFGKNVATLLEHADESMKHIKQYSHPEYKLNVTIDGVPIFGFIDSFDPETLSYLEYKTGKQPWTQARVDKHFQLDLYSVCIEELFGDVHDECELIWMETRKIDKPQMGLTTALDSYEIEFTGNVRSFLRTITKSDRQEARKNIVRISDEIKQDYQEWLKANAPKVGLY